MLSVVIGLQTAAQRLFLARSHDVQPSESAGHVFLFINTVRSSHLQLSTVHVGVHGTVSCRTALTRRHWTFYVCTLTD